MDVSSSINERGLSEEEITKRHIQFGYNQLDSQHVYWWQVLLRQLTSPFLYLLAGASLLSFFLGERIDGIMIILFVLINTALGFYQEYHSEQTLTFLKKYVQPQARVIRSGVETLVATSQLVPGDIVLLKAGDIIPADLQMLEQNNITIDESVLTGESEPREIHRKDALCYCGTTIVAGIGRGVVVTIGKETALGKITKLTVETHRTSSFEKEISRFSRFILFIIIITLVGVFIINVAIKGSSVHIPSLLIFSIALAVSVIPEALPIIITFSLSRGALRLAKNKVVVKRLSAIEDLGSIEVLCTDKTGTLTENNLTLHEVYKNVDDVVIYGALSSTLAINNNVSAHSFDRALLQSLSKQENELFKQFDRVQEIPFDPVRKRSGMVVKSKNTYELIIRGAFEEVITLCTPMSEREHYNIKKWMAHEEGNRIIAVAKKTIPFTKGEDVLNKEKQMIFVGLISFIDPIKKTATEAIKEAHTLGIMIKILTGDSGEVAGSVAQTIGIIADKKMVLTGAQFDALSLEEQRGAVEAYSVFARVSPQQKFSIISLLQEKYEVGFLGEGINDAPALKIANMAMVVQGATDVAREAADIILLKKSLHVIIDGIKEGRETFANTSKYIRATLASNFGNFYTLAIASLFLNFLPLLPLQILLINLLTDLPMLAIATDTVDSGQLARPRTYGIKEIALIGTIMGIVSSLFDFIILTLFYHSPAPVLQTNWFIASVLTEIVFLFSIRTRLPILFAKRASLPLIILSIGAFVAALVIPMTSVGHVFFSFISPSLPHITTILAIVFMYLATTELVKILYYKLPTSFFR